MTFVEKIMVWAFSVLLVMAVIAIYSRTTMTIRVLDANGNAAHEITTRR